MSDTAQIDLAANAAKQDAYVASRQVARDRTLTQEAERIAEHGK